MQPIFHITTRSDWLAAAGSGSYTADTLASEGFIHCSFRDQVLSVANARFRDRNDLVLLQIDPEGVEAPIREENLEGGSAHFPHIYGALECSAVRRVLAFSPGDDGSFSLPPEI